MSLFLVLEKFWRLVLTHVLVLISMVVTHSFPLLIKLGELSSVYSANDSIKVGRILLSIDVNIVSYN